MHVTKLFLDHAVVPHYRQRTNSKKRVLMEAGSDDVGLHCGGHSIEVINGAACTACPWGSPMSLDVRLPVQPAASQPSRRCLEGK